MNEFQTYEVITHQKTEGIWILKRISLIFCYIAYVLALLLIGLSTRIIVPLLALIPITLWMIIYFSWKYVNIDYEYSMTSGHLTFSKIYGSRKRKVMFETEIKSISLIAPYNDKYFAEAERYAPVIEYNSLSSSKASNQYFALFENKDEKKSIFIFEAEEKSLKIFKFYNSSATIIEKKES